MKNLLILGSNSDIAQACAYTFAQKGFHITLASRQSEGYQQRLASDISIRHDINCETVLFDALTTEIHLAFYESLIQKPDVVICAFGVLGDQKIAEQDFEQAKTIINTNFLGSVSILGVVANDMEKRKRGTIIGISSVAGERGRKSNYFYGSSKAGMTAFLSGLRARLAASGVRVSTVLPGFVKTKMIDGITTPKLLTATPEQVANAIWKAYSKRKNTVYILGIWRYIMLIIKSLPEFIFKKMNL